MAKKLENMSLQELEQKLQELSLKVDELRVEMRAVNEQREHLLALEKYNALTDTERAQLLKVATIQDGEQMGGVK